MTEKLFGIGAIILAVLFMFIGILTIFGYEPPDKRLIIDCEAELPRNQSCELIAMPIKEKNDECNL
ncbi:MAG: hypothetical protein DRR06_19475 [Gammaproteobacteria bacterium]|nr:MAG: hypothetical protein DRR06_19475 [Gammaproteobacteria bacterium]